MFQHDPLMLIEPSSLASKDVKKERLRRERTGIEVSSLQCCAQKGAFSKAPGSASAAWKPPLLVCSMQAPRSSGREKSSAQCSFCVVLHLQRRKLPYRLQQTFASFL